MRLFPDKRKFPKPKEISTLAENGAIQKEGKERVEIQAPKRHYPVVY